jgi:hypothetical protein
MRQADLGTSIGHQLGDKFGHHWLLRRDIDEEHLWQAS